MPSSEAMSSDEKAASEKFVSKIVSRNIAELVEFHRQRNERLGPVYWISDRLTCFAGSARFFILHLVWFAVWMVYNGGLWPGAKPFDPYPFEFLTFIVSLEAILLSILVLLIQNQIQKDADRRAELDVHINLLDERESTAILRKITRIEEKLGIAVGDEEAAEVQELLRETNPIDIEKILDRIN